MKKYLKNLNLYILSIIFLLAFAVLYFLYNRQRSQAEVYAMVNIRQGTSTPTVSSTGAISLSVPYWLDNAISVNDRDISPLGGVNLEVIDKESYEYTASNRNVYLLLKVNAVKDRSGTLLFKNKPLLVGSTMDIKLPKSQMQGIVIGISDRKSVFETRKIMVSGHDMSVEEETARNLSVGSRITNNKGDVIARITEKQIKKTNPVGLLYDPRSELFEGANTTKVDVIVKMEMTVKKIDDRYFFMETQKVKPDEFVFIPFKEVSLNLLVTSVKEL